MLTLMFQHHANDVYLVHELTECIGHHFLVATASLLFCLQPLLAVLLS
jgi:hypothetical protein